MSSNRTRVAVVYNVPHLDPDHPDAASEGDVVTVARAVAAALDEAGYCPTWLPACPPLSSFLERLVQASPDFVFNLIEGFGGSSAAEPHVASVYELIGLAYTGSPVEALANCRSKARTKALLRGSGLPTAPSVVAVAGEPIPPFDWRGRVIVKPEAEDASLGIDQESVVSSIASAGGRVQTLQHAYGGAVLIEAYLPGPEYNVGVLATPEPRTLPVAQVVFAERPGSWPILTYAGKWDVGSSEDLASPVVCPASVGSELANRLGSLALAAFRATGCRDYARVDFRLDDQGAPMILEVNPNPDLGPGAGWARAARVAGLGHTEAVSLIARQASRRAEILRRKPGRPVR